MSRFYEIVNQDPITVLFAALLTFAVVGLITFALVEYLRLPLRLRLRRISKKRKIEVIKRFLKWRRDKRVRHKEKMQRVKDLRKFRRL